MKFISVESSNLRAVAYEVPNLFVEFHHGGVYAYYGVPEHVYQALLAAPSKGCYHAQHIKWAYPYKRVR